MAGSVSINVDLPDTEAYVQDATLTLGGDSWVKANEAAEIAAIAGSGAYGGSKGFGVAIAINLIGFDLAGTSEPARHAGLYPGLDRDARRRHAVDHGDRRRPDDPAPDHRDHRLRGRRHRGGQHRRRRHDRGQ